MAETIENPYVGPRPFEKGDRSSFFGRDQEIRQLASLIIARRVVVLYARSGAGKTSLLKAGLVPYLEQQKKIRVLPMARVAGDIPVGLQPARGQNLNVLNILLYMFEEGGKSAELLGMTLEDGLGRCLAPAPGEKRLRPRRSLLILDQLEELFTVRAERGDPQVLFRQLRSALAALPRLSLVLSLRESYIARLDPFAELLPDRLRTRFRLDMLSEAAARQAMQEPARLCGAEFTDAAAAALIDDLRMVRVQRPDGSVAEQSGSYVEPVQLQVVCQRLFTATAGDGGGRRIEPTDVAAVGSVDCALADYYRDRVIAVATATGISARRIRDWVESELITEHGIRAQVLKEPERTRGLPNRALQALVDVHLVRTETRRGAIWYELTHDRLLEPLRLDNAAWREANFSLLQRRAVVWENEGRPASLLMQGEELKGGNRWAAAHSEELMPAEREYLSLSNRKAGHRRRRRLEVATVAVIVGALSLLYVGHVVVNRWQSHSHELAATALGPMHHQRDLALLLSLEANRIGGRVGDAFAARASLCTGLQDPGLERFLHGHTETVHTVAFSPDNRWLASGGSDQRILLWDLDQDPPRPENLRRLTAGDAPICKLVFSPGPERKLVAAGGEENRILVWDLTSGSRKLWKIDLRDPSLIFCSLAFSPDGDLLAAGSKTGTVLLLRGAASAGRLDKWTEQGRWQSPAGRISSLVFSPDGESLVVGEGRDGAGESHAVILGLKEGGLVETGRLAVAGGYRAGVSSLAFSADGELLATGYGHEAQLWDSATGEKLGEPLTDHRGRIVEIGFAGSGRSILSVTADGFITAWTAFREPRFVHRDLNGYLAPLRSAALSSDGERMALSVGPAIVLWRAEQIGDRVGEYGVVRRGITQLLTRSSKVESVSFAGGTVAAAVDGSDRRWTLGDNGLWQLLEERPGDQAVPSNQGVKARSGPPDPACRVISEPDEPLVRCQGGKLWLNLRGKGWTGLTGHGHDVLTVALSRDGKILASAGKDWTIRLWDLTADPPGSRALTGHAGVVNSLAFWPPGEEILVSAGKEGTVILWNVATGTPVGRPLTLYHGAVKSIAFSDNGEWAATGGEDGLIVWDLSYDSWRETACRIANRNLSHDEWDRFISPRTLRRKTCPDLPWPEEGDGDTLPAGDPRSACQVQSQSATGA